MGEAAQLGKNLIILAEKIINCVPDEKVSCSWLHSFFS